MDKIYKLEKKLHDLYKENITNTNEDKRLFKLRINNMIFTIPKVTVDEYIYNDEEMVFNREIG